MQATESKSLIQSKSLLAKLMAMENITIEQRPVPTAMFDVKNRILTIPVLDEKISSELYDLFVGHEVAHALWTPMDGLLKAHEQKVSKGVTNCVEDARIERKIKVKYPGLRNSFTKAYRELMSKNFFNTDGYDINDMNFIDRANLYFKSGASLGIEFTPEERELVNEIGSTETYDDVIEVSKKICSFMKEQYDQRAQNSDSEDESEDFDFDFDSNDSSHYNYDEDYDSEDSDDSNGSNADSDDYDSEETEDGDSSEDSQGEFEDDGDSESDSGTGEATNSSGRKDSNAKQAAGFVEFNEEDIRSYTDEALKQNESMLFAANSQQINYANIPQFDLNNHIVDHKYLYKKYREDSDLEFAVDREGFQKIRKDTSKIVSFLAKEFELRKNADQLKRASTAKTGDLNMSKIFSYQFNEDIFKKITVLPGGKSHGLVMFLDWSGSMNHHMPNTVKQLISIVMFCKKVNIPFEVYCFSESGPNEPHRPTPKDGDLGMDAFFLLNILSSRMSASEFTFAASALVYISSPNRRYSSCPHWFMLGSTPFNEAIISAMDIVPAFQAKYKLQIVNTVFLTDGEANQCRTIYRKDIITGNLGHDYCADNYKRRLIVRDPITRNEVTVRNLYDRGALTAGLIKLLKMRTDCNVVGFYLLSSRDFRREMYQWFPHNKQIDMRAKFRKEKFAIVKSAGFDEYYLMRSEGHSLDNLNEDEDFVVEEGATTRKLVNAFSKYTSNRLANRVVLNRFVGMIA
jgi:hypothetical protein